MIKNLTMSGFYIERPRGLELSQGRYFSAAVTKAYRKRETSKMTEKAKFKTMAKLAKTPEFTAMMAYIKGAENFNQTNESAGVKSIASIITKCYYNAEEISGAITTSDLINMLTVDALESIVGTKDKADADRIKVDINGKYEELGTNHTANVLSILGFDGTLDALFLIFGDIRHYTSPDVIARIKQTNRMK